jgi:Ca2+-binding RTX toxin-like protein
MQSDNPRWSVHLFRVASIVVLLTAGGTTAAQAQSEASHELFSTTPTCEGQPATIVGTNGDDAITGTAGDDVILGLGGDDVIHGLGGVDLICGGPGNDALDGGPGSDGLIGGGGNDTLRCGPGFDDGGLSGGGGNDKLYGESLCANALLPGPGDDLVVGGGDASLDAVHYEDATGPIHANLMTGIATGQGTDTLVGVDAVLSGPYDDTLIGGDGDNLLVGRAGDDTLIGNGGDDTFSGQQGDDIYRGGPGSDLAEYYDQAAADDLRIGPMNVNLQTGIATGDGTDTLSSIEGATGSDKADTMIGNAKDNTFVLLFAGNDIVKAGGGDDFVGPGTGANVLSGGTGEDLLFYVGGSDEEHGHPALIVNLAAGTSSAGDTLSGFEDVFGSAESDTLIGDGAANALYGNTGDDVLKGLGGDDRLVGLGGADAADGGSGTDRCRAETTTNCEIILTRPSGGAEASFLSDVGPGLRLAMRRIARLESVSA